MKRKEFIQLATKLGLGGVLLPQFLASCADENPFAETDFKGKILIIGAGVSGLYAGYLLKEYGIDFTILEASDVVGGRMGQKKDFADFPIDLGAQWMHGGNSIMSSLVTSKGVDTFYDDSGGVYWYKNELVSSLPANIEKLMEDASNCDEDITIKECFDKNGGTEDEFYLLTQATGDVGASPDKISSKWEGEGYNLYSNGTDDYKFVKSYFDVIETHILPVVQDNIELNAVVNTVDYSGSEIAVTLAGGETYTADKLLVTVPLTVLKDGDIEFSPALPSSKTESFKQLGMEPGMKAFMRFSERFFDENIGGGKVCAAYVNESYNRDTNDHVLFGFVMGEQARALSDMGDATALQALLAELDEMYDGKASASYVDHFFQDWYQQPYVRGAYSYPLVGATENTRENLAESVDDKLFFAGEATNTNGHHATVHGAIESAYREVINILKTVS